MRLPRSVIRSVVLLLSAPVVFPGPAAAGAGPVAGRRAGPAVGSDHGGAAPAAVPTRGVQDRWTRLCPGVRHLHRSTTAPLSVHVLEVDLRAPGVTVEVTPWKRRWLTPTQYGRATGAVAAVNGGFWSVFDAKPEGLVVHDAERWPGVRDDEFYGFFAITRRGRALISPAAAVWRRRVSRLREAVSGLQRILHRGRVTAEARCDDGCRYRQPRTAVGVDRAGHRVWLAVVDGRQAHSRGLSLPALARMLRGLGAREAINLDGGGSAALYLASKKGLANAPADRKEREVLNHVGVFWRPTAAQLATHRASEALLRAAIRAETLLAAAPAPRPGAPAALDHPPAPDAAGAPTGYRRWLQRHWREILSPRNLLVFLPALLSLGLLGIWAQRRLRRRDRKRDRRAAARRAALPGPRDG